MNGGKLLGERRREETEVGNSIIYFFFYWALRAYDDEVKITKFLMEVREREREREMGDGRWVCGLKKWWRFRAEVKDVLGFRNVLVASPRFSFSLFRSSLVFSCAQPLIFSFVRK